MNRTDNRKYDQLRKISLTPHISEYAEGSCLVEFGKTKVLCTASFESSPAKWLQNTGKGWVTAEYGMLPRSTQDRIKRDKAMTSGRTQEIARLIGRSLRCAVDLTLMNEKQIMVDCDVIHADGGTRTASVTGGFVALALALKKQFDKGELKAMPLKRYISAVSVGLKGSQTLLDLNYVEDSTIHTDMNFVMTGEGHFVEIQGTAEGEPFSQQDMQKMTEVAHKGCQELFIKQSEIISSFFQLKR